MRAGLAVGTAMVAGIMALAGCSSSSKTAKAVPAASTSGVTIDAKNFSFSPSTLSATAGKAMTVTIRNTGSAKHNFTIKELGVDKDLDVGSSVTVTFTPKSAGTLTYYCEYHKAIGMTGTLRVAG